MSSTGLAQDHCSTLYSEDGTSESKSNSSLDPWLFTLWVRNAFLFVSLYLFKLLFSFVLVFAVEDNIHPTIESFSLAHCLLIMREHKGVSVSSISISIWMCTLSLPHTLTHKPIYFSNPSLSTLSCIQKCYLACLYLRTRKHMLNHSVVPNAQAFTLLCDASTITEQSSLDVMYNCTVYSAKFCRCHHGIVIYRHACQDQESLSSSMAIAKCVAKTCVAGAGVSPPRLSEKTLPERHYESLSVYTCPIPLPFHSKWLFIMAGMDLTASSYLSNSIHRRCTG